MKEEISGEEILSPMPGTYYNSSSPDSDPFVKVGDTVSEGDTLCIIEAMKILNEIEAETSGVISKIILEDGQAVEYNQPLFVIEPF
jgi:acetyl-CoA carboxylase biotin carboxyl carrier protein